MCTCNVRDYSSGTGIETQPGPPAVDGHEMTNAERLNLKRAYQEVENGTTDTRTAYGSCSTDEQLMMAQASTFKPIATSAQVGKPGEDKAAQHTEAAEEESQNANLWRVNNEDGDVII